MAFQNKKTWSFHQIETYNLVISPDQIRTRQIYLFCLYCLFLNNLLKFQRLIHAEKSNCREKFLWHIVCVKKCSPAYYARIKI